MKRLHIVMFLFLSVSGCAVMPTADEITKADFGPIPIHEEVESLIRERLMRSLVDPDSLKQFKVYPAKKNAYKCGLTGSINVFVWSVPYEYNAKNRMGGYTGLKSDTISFLKGKEVTVCAYADGTLIQ